eukprot:2813790-Rhodomonas_salina.3
MPSGMVCVAPGSSANRRVSTADAAHRVRRTAAGVRRTVAGVRRAIADMQYLRAEACRLWAHLLACVRPPRTPHG